MNSQRKVLLLALFLIFITPLHAQQNAANPKVEVEKINEKLSRIVCTSRFSVNITACSGEDGTLIVDSGMPETAPLLQKTLNSLGNGRLRLLINTHFHGDHTGGNALLADQATIIAHENLRKRLLSLVGIATLGDNPKSLPTITFAKDLTLYLNGEEIHLLYRPDTHGDDDVIVHFVKSKVVATGDLLFADMFPYIALRMKGNLQNYIENIRYFIESFEPGTIFVPSHGRNYVKDDLTEYLTMLTKTKELVEKEIMAGRELDDIKLRDTLKGWNKWVGPFPTTTKNAWIDTIYYSFTAKQNLSLEPIEEHLRTVYDQKGIDATIEEYQKLKQKEGNKYDFSEIGLNLLGYYLLGKGKASDAIRIFQLNVEMFPKSANVYDSLGEAYMASGNREMAIKNYERSVQLNPENQNAKDKLEELKKSKE